MSKGAVMNGPRSMSIPQSELDKNFRINEVLKSKGPSIDASTKKAIDTVRDVIPSWTDEFDILERLRERSMDAEAVITWYYESGASAQSEWQETGRRRKKNKDHGEGTGAGKSFASGGRADTARGGRGGSRGAAGRGAGSRENGGSASPAAGRGARGRSATGDYGYSAAPATQTPPFQPSKPPSSAVPAAPADSYSGRSSDAYAAASVSQAPPGPASYPAGAGLNPSALNGPSSMSLHSSVSAAQQLVRPGLAGTIGSPLASAAASGGPAGGAAALAAGRGVGRGSISASGLSTPMMAPSYAAASQGASVGSWAPVGGRGRGSVPGQAAALDDATLAAERLTPAGAGAALSSPAADKASGTAPSSLPSVQVQPSPQPSRQALPPGARSAAPGAPSALKPIGQPAPSSPAEQGSAALSRMLPHDSDASDRQGSASAVGPALNRSVGSDRDSALAASPPAVAPSFSAAVAPPQSAQTAAARSQSGTQPQQAAPYNPPSQSLNSSAPSPADAVAPISQPSTFQPIGASRQTISATSTYNPPGISTKQAPVRAPQQWKVKEAPKPAASGGYQDQTSLTSASSQVTASSAYGASAVSQALPARTQSQSQIGQAADHQTANAFSNYSSQSSVYASASGASSSPSASFAQSQTSSYAPIGTAYKQAQTQSPVVLPQQLQDMEASLNLQFGTFSLGLFENDDYGSAENESSDRSTSEAPTSHSLSAFSSVLGGMTSSLTGTAAQTDTTGYGESGSGSADTQSQLSSQAATQSQTQQSHHFSRVSHAQSMPSALQSESVASPTQQESDHQPVSVASAHYGYMQIPSAYAYAPYTTSFDGQDSQTADTSRLQRPVAGFYDANTAFQAQATSFRPPSPSESSKLSYGGVSQGSSKALSYSAPKYTQADLKMAASTTSAAQSLSQPHSQSHSQNALAAQGASSIQRGGASLAQGSQQGQLMASSQQSASQGQTQGQAATQSQAVQQASLQQAQSSSQASAQGGYGHTQPMAMHAYQASQGLGAMAAGSAAYPPMYAAYPSYVTAPYASASYPAPSAAQYSAYGHAVKFASPIYKAQSGPAAAGTYAAFGNPSLGSSYPPSANLTGTAGSGLGPSYGDDYSHDYKAPHLAYMAQHQQVPSFFMQSPQQPLGQDGVSAVSSSAPGLGSKANSSAAPSIGSVNGLPKQQPHHSLGTASSAASNASQSSSAALSDTAYKNQNAYVGGAGVRDLSSVSAQAASSYYAPQYQQASSAHQHQAAFHSYMTQSQHQPTGQHHHAYTGQPQPQGQPQQQSAVHFPPRANQLQQFWAQ